MLPAIKSSSSFFGAVNSAVWLQAPSTSIDTQQLDRYTGCSITGVLGDQQAALFVSLLILITTATVTTTHKSYIISLDIYGHSFHFFTLTYLIIVLLVLSLLRAKRVSKLERPNVHMALVRFSYSILVQVLFLARKGC